MKTGTLYIAKKNAEQRSLRQMVLESSIVLGMTELFSAILGEKITPIKAIKLANAQAAIGALLLLGGLSPLVAAVLLVWVVVSTYQCGEHAE